VISGPPPVSGRFTESWDAVDPYDPGYPHLWVKVEHLARYLFAADLLRARGSRLVADIACGTGFGLAELSTASERVIGVDADAELLESARGRLDANVELLHHVVGQVPLADVIPSHSLDAVTSFETIEHLIDPERGVRELFASLKSGGTLIASVPNSLTEQVGADGLPYNPLHKRAFTYASFQRLLTGAGFQVEHHLGQALVNDIARNEARAIRREQIDGRVADCDVLHSDIYVRRLAYVVGYPSSRDVERSYSMIVVATRRES
jgi:SAM-dependent methyltransferase